MAEQILLYGRMNEYSVRDFFTQVSEATKEDPNAELHFRINSEGGNPEYTWGAITRMIETANKKVKVDAMAHSMWAIGLCYFDDVEATDVSQFVLHRAAFPDWFEADPRCFTELIQENLMKVNIDLEKAMRAKIDVPLFEEITGVKVREIFSMTGRVEVLLDATKARKIGLIQSIQKITPSKKASIDAELARIEARYSVPLSKAADVNTPEIKIENQPTTKVMTLEELKSKHPELYNQSVTEGKAAGVSEERDRIRGWEAFRHIDAEAVTKGIKEGKIISAADMAEFSAKAVSPEFLKKLASASVPPVETADAPVDQKTADQKTLDQLEADAKNIVKNNYGGAASKEVTFNTVTA